MLCIPRGDVNMLLVGSLQVVVISGYCVCQSRVASVMVIFIVHADQIQQTCPI